MEQQEKEKPKFKLPETMPNSMQSEAYREKVIVWVHKHMEGMGMASGLRLTRRFKRMYKTLQNDKKFNPTTEEIQAATVALYYTMEDTKRQRAEYGEKVKKATDELNAEIKALNEQGNGKPDPAKMRALAARAKRLMKGQFK